MIADLLEVPPNAWETIKWAGPISLSLFALGWSVYYGRRSSREGSSRARQQYNSDLRRWCNDGIATFGEAILAVKSKEIDGRGMASIASRLSILADQGRLFFPNLHANLHGSEKEAAHRGFRPRIIDWLIFAVDACGVANELPDWELAEVLVLLKRGFNSDSQLAIEPRNLFTNMENLQRLLLESEFMEVSQSHKNLKAARTFIEDRKSKRPKR